MPLNENAKKWVDALRSGKYQQGQWNLQKGDKYCCLGVACELAIENGLPIEKQKVYGGAFSFNDELDSLPDEVREWLGLASIDGEYGEDDLLTLDNDGTAVKRPKTFNEIADIIESEPEGLFV